MPAIHGLHREPGTGRELFYTDTTENDDTALMTTDCSVVEFEVVGDGGGGPPPAPPGMPSPTPKATTPAGSCGGASAEVTGLQKTGSPEVVSVTGSGDLTDWYLISVRGNQRFDFPDGFVLNGTVDIHSAVPQFPNTANTLWWTGANVWNDSEDDDAALYDCSGTLGNFWDD